MAPDNFVKLCRPRFTSFSPLKEVYSEAVLVATLGATGFEPHDPTAPRNERAIHNKPAFVKECVVVRHCEAQAAEWLRSDLTSQPEGRVEYEC